MSKKNLDLKNGFYRFENRIEINWGIYEWALPLGFYLDNSFTEVRLLCFSVFIPRNHHKQ